MKGFEVGKRVRAKMDIWTDLKKGDITTILGIDYCCGVLLIYFGAPGSGYCERCNNRVFDKPFANSELFDPIEDDEIEIKSDTFKQVTFTKIIENVPSGVN